MEEIKNYILNIVERLKLQGISITQEQIDTVLKMYENSDKSIEVIKDEIDKLVQEFLLQLQVNIENYDKKAVTLKRYNDGEEKVLEEDIDIVGKAGLGFNAPTILNFGDKVGYFKNSRDTSWVFLDSFEYVICQLGKKLGVKMAETYRVYDGLIPLGIISENIATNGNLCMTSVLAKSLSSVNPDLLNKINYLNEKSQNNMITINDKGVPNNIPLLDNEVDIKYAIDLFLDVVKGLNVKDGEYQEIRQDYFNMIMLDFLTNNVDRNKNNYGLLMGEDRVSFAPLFDNSTISIPSVPDNVQQINGFFMNKDVLLNSLVKYYPNEIRSFVTKAQSDEFRMFSERICGKELTNNEFNCFWNKNFVNNLAKINTVDLENAENLSMNHSEEMAKDKGPKLTRIKPNNTENGGHINVIGLSLLILLVEIITFAFIYLLIKK